MDDDLVTNQYRCMPEPEQDLQYKYENKTGSEGFHHNTFNIALVVSTHPHVLTLEKARWT